MAAAPRLHLAPPVPPLGLPPYFTSIVGLACGRFCSVYKAFDARSSQNVALKQPHRAFSDVAAARSTFREIRLLRTLHHENLVPLLDLFFINDEETGSMDIFMAQELMQSNLEHVLALQKLDEPRARHVTFQILNALQYMHSRGIVHRDLRPSNVGINGDCTVKLLDFGMARFLPGGRPVLTTMNTEIMGYSSPEAIFNLSYDKKVDLWAVGCIVGEMLEGFKLFDAPTPHQLIAQWHRLLGAPSLGMDVGTSIYQAVLAALVAGPEEPFQSLLDRFADSVEGERRRRWTHLTGTARSTDLLLRLLAYDSRERLSAEEALHNDYFQSYRDETLEAVGEGPAVESVEYWQGRVISEVSTYMMSRLMPAPALPPAITVPPSISPSTTPVPSPVTPRSAGGLFSSSPSTSPSSLPFASLCPSSAAPGFLRSSSGGPRY